MLQDDSASQYSLFLGSDEDEDHVGDDLHVSTDNADDLKRPSDPRLDLSETQILPTKYSPSLDLLTNTAVPIVVRDTTPSPPQKHGSTERFCPIVFKWLCVNL